MNNLTAVIYNPAALGLKGLGRRLRPRELPTCRGWGGGEFCPRLSLALGFAPEVWQYNADQKALPTSKDPKLILLFIKPGLPAKARGPFVAITAYIIIFLLKKCSIPTHI